jgi:general secretion pathway protein G
MLHREHSFTAYRHLLHVIAAAVLVSNPVANTAAGLSARQGETSTSAKEAALKRALFDMRDAIDHYYSDYGRYPNDLKTLVTAGYIAKIPADPFTNRTDSWRTIPARPNPRDKPRRPAGIYDVKSRSRRTAMDGTRYSDW